MSTTPPSGEHDPPDTAATDTAATDTDAPGSGTLPEPAAIALVAAGGILGTAARYELELLAPAGDGRFPWTTFGINVSGALVLGAVLTLLTGRWERRRGGAVARPLLTTGFLGAYTTWSTYMVETALLARHGDAVTALAYLAASMVAGLAAATVGVTAAGRMAGPTT